MSIFSILHLPIHTQAVSLSIEVCRFCNFQHASLIHVLLDFIYFGAIIHGIVFLIFVSICSLLVYRNVIHFCVLILCPAALLNSLILKVSFVNFLGILS